MNKAHLTLVAAVVSVGVGLQSAPATALPVSIKIDLNANSTARNMTSNSSDSTVVEGNSNTRANVNASASDRDTDENGRVNAFIANSNASADNRGWFVQDAKGTGAKFDADSTMVQTAKVTNNTNAAQAVKFDFVINEGKLGLNFSNSNREQALPIFGVGESVASSYSAQILLNGNSIWDSSAVLKYDQNGYSFTGNGQALSTYSNGDNSYGWGQQSSSLSLGTLAAGQSFELKYIVKTAVLGNSALLTACNGVHGKVTLTNVELPGATCMSASSLFGDPNRFGVAPAFNTASFTSLSSSTSATPKPVPEPASIAVFGASLVGLGFMRREKRQTKS